MTTPRITFLLPVYNGAATIADTVDSVLSQSLADLELLIIDDASTDATAEILAAMEDPRLRIFRNATNLELSGTLNRGLSLAQSDYVARIDADDICLPHRAQTQVDYLDAHPDIAVVGSFVETFTADIFERGTTIAFPISSAAIAAGLIFRNTMAHPTVALRISALAAVNIQYDPSIRRAQDYALWAHCTAANLQLANIPDVLVRYRVHPGQATARESLASLSTAAAVRRGLIERLGITPSPEQLAVHSHLALDDLPADPAFIRAADAWLKKLLTANKKSKSFDQEAFARVLTGRFVALWRHARNTSAALDAKKSPFAPFINPGALE